MVIKPAMTYDLQQVSRIKENEHKINKILCFATSDTFPDGKLTHFTVSLKKVFHSSKQEDTYLPEILKHNIEYYKHNKKPLTKDKEKLMQAAKEISKIMSLKRKHNVTAYTTRL